MKKSIFSKKLLVSFGSLVALTAIPLIAISCGQTTNKPSQSQQPGSGSTTETGGQTGSTSGTSSTTGTGSTTESSGQADSTTNPGTSGSTGGQTGSTSGTSSTTG
ncbi:variable surface lipoprotein, partial [Mesomycoplasma hyorhinis]